MNMAATNDQLFATQTLEDLQSLRSQLGQLHILSRFIGFLYDKVAPGKRLPEVPVSYWDCCSKPGIFGLSIDW